MLRHEAQTDTFGVMPIQLNHPIRLLRIERDMTTSALAEAAQLHRSTVQAIEEGRTVQPDELTVSRLAQALRVPTQELQNRLGLWLEEQRPPVLLAPAGRAVLELDPAVLSQRFWSFVAWRSQLAPSPTAFASMLGVNRKVVADYEAGRKRRGLPLSMSSAMIRRFRVSVEYVTAVEALPVGGEEA